MGALGCYQATPWVSARVWVGTRRHRHALAVRRVVAGESGAGTARLPQVEHRGRGDPVKAVGPSRRIFEQHGMGNSRGDRLTLFRAGRLDPGGDREPRPPGALECRFLLNFVVFGGRGSVLRTAR